MLEIYARKILKFDPDDLWDGKIVGDKISVVFDDGKLVMSATEIILSAYAWAYHTQIPTLPLLTCHTIKTYYKDGHPTRAMHVDLMETIYSLVLDLKQISKPEITYKLVEIACVANNNLYNKAFYATARYIRSTWVVDDLELIDDPTLVELKDKLLDVQLDESIVAKAIANATNVLNNDVINDKGIINVWSWLATRSLVKTKQLVQNIFMRGYITDTDGFVIDFPVLDSYMSGMRTYRSYNIVARENAVAIESQQDELRRASSDSRRMTYSASYRRGIVYEDCGSKDYLQFHVKDEAHLNIAVGTYHKHDKYEKLQRIEKTHKHLIGTIINVRSQFTCKIDDPSMSCSTCVGALSESIPAGVNLGADISRAIHQIIVQSKMSKKHFLDSSSGNDSSMSPDFVKMMRENNARFIYLRDVVHKRAKRIIFRIAGTNTNLLSVYDVVNIDMMTLSQVSTINHLELLIETKTKKVEIDFPTDKGGVKAMFSYRALRYLHEEYHKGHERITVKGENIEVDMTGFDFSQPILKRPNIASDDDQPNRYLIELYERVGSEVKKGDDANILETLQEIIDLSAKLDMKVSLGAIETILSAYICKDGGYNLARGFTGTHHATATRVLSNRSLSLFSMLRDQKKMITSVGVYLVEDRDDSVLDIIMDPIGMLKKHNIKPTKLIDDFRARKAK